MAAEVSQALQPLHARGFHAGEWTLQKFVEVKLDTGGFLNVLKLFMDHGDQIVDAALADAGIDPPTCTLQAFYRFISDLEKRAGKLLLARVERALMINKIMEAGETPREAALMYAFNQQIKQVKKLHLSEPQTFQQLKNDFLPASSYEGPTRKSDKAEFLKVGNAQQTLILWMMNKAIESGNAKKSFAKFKMFVACLEAIGDVVVPDQCLDLLIQAPRRKKRAREAI